MFRAATSARAARSTVAGFGLSRCMQRPATCGEPFFETEVLAGKWGDGPRESPAAANVVPNHSLRATVGRLCVRCGLDQGQKRRLRLSFA